MTSFLALLLAVSSPAGDKQPKPPAPAQVTVTGELVCLHCHIGEGDSCAPALRLDGKVPLILAGKAAKKFEELTFDEKKLVATGALSLNKNKRMVLTSDDAQVLTGKEKVKVPPLGRARLVGTPICGKCQLMVCEECTLAVANGKAAIILDGKYAQDHAEDYRTITATGRLFIDRRGLLRLDATKVDLTKK